MHFTPCARAALAAAPFLPPLGTLRPVGAGLVPARGRPQGPPLLPGFRSRRTTLWRLCVGAGAHTRPELAGGPEGRADVGIGPYRGLLRQAPPGKMLRRGGACPRLRAAIKAAPTSGVPFPAGYLAALGRRGGCPHPPAGRPAEGVPRVRRYAGRGGLSYPGRGNIHGKLYRTLSAPPVGIGGQLPADGFQRGLRQN